MTQETATAHGVQQPPVTKRLAQFVHEICRIAMQLADRSYKQEFHNTATAGIFGCVAAICSLRRLPAEIIVMAFGLAASKAAGSMQFLENGSWNKRLHPGFATYDAFLCVSLAEAGVVGADQCLEGRFGLFHAYSTRDPDLNALVKDLNHEWHFLGTALKPFAACQITHGAIDIASQLARSVRLDRVEKITVTIQDRYYKIISVPSSNKIHPISSMPNFPCTTSWLQHGCTGLGPASQCTSNWVTHTSTSSRRRSPSLETP